MKSDKPGYKTTEFWSMILAAIFGILLLTGFMTSKETTDMMLYANSIAGSCVTIASVVSYILSRGKAKSKPEIDYDKLLNDIRNVINENNTYK